MYIYIYNCPKSLLVVLPTYILSPIVQLRVNNAEENTRNV